MKQLFRTILETKRPTKYHGEVAEWMANLLTSLMIPYVRDMHNNFTVIVGQSTTAFTAHTDTVDNKLGKNKLLISNGTVRVEGGGVLGADCGTGIYILLRMIMNDVPGRYVFFAQEEVGRVGSTAYTMPKEINRVISFDRKETDNLITHQMGEPGCSEEFAKAFITEFQLPYKRDPTGCFTDSYTFFETHAECVNLSVGYYHQHSSKEYQDVDFAEQLIKACVVMPWEDLPTHRVPEPYDYRGYNSYGGYYANQYKPSSKSVYEEEDMEDYCYMNYNTVAAYLEDHGVTVKDIEDHAAYVEWHNEEEEDMETEDLLDEEEESIGFDDTDDFTDEELQHLMAQGSWEWNE